MDYTDQASVDAFYVEFKSLREEFNVHRLLEEKCIHPLLSERVPGGARRLEEEHRDQNRRWEDLLAEYDAIRSKPASFTKRREQSLEFYRAFNRFIALYLTHINEEEEVVQRTLWDICTKEDLGSAMSMILVNQKPAELMQNLEMMIPAMNLDERAELFMGIEATAPPDVFRTICDLAKRVLSYQDWSNLKSRVGITCVFPLWVESPCFFGYLMTLSIDNAYRKAETPRASKTSSSASLP